MNFDLNQNYENAVTLHQAGRLSEAEGIYRNILAIDPKHVDSMHLLGVIALQVGRNDIAVDLIGKAIAANKRNADFHNNIGVALRALGRLDEASTTSGGRSSSSPTTRTRTTTSAFA